MDVEQLVRIAERLPDAIRERASGLGALQERVAYLAANSCPGVEYWRDNATSPKLYINHGIDEACPVHGKPEPGGRIRAYIGTDADKQGQAKVYIANHKHLNAANRELRELEGAFSTIRYNLRRLFQSIGYIMPEVETPAQAGDTGAVATEQLEREARINEIEMWGQDGRPRGPWL
jgi:hypothetical protein